MISFSLFLVLIISMMALCSGKCTNFKKHSDFTFAKEFAFVYLSLNCLTLVLACFPRKFMFVGAQC